MKSIEELQADLKQLYAELEERRIMEQESIPQTVNFDEISSRAERYKIENHPMRNRDEHEQSMYLLMLISVAVIDETRYENSFSLIYRIAHGMNFRGDVQELFLQAKQIDFKRLDDITRLFINDDVRLVMLMEAMMIAQGFKKEYKKAMEYIAELCILMKLEKEQVILISNIARVMLMMNVDEYKCNIKNPYNVFNCYLSMIETQMNFKVYRYESENYQKCHKSGFSFILPIQFWSKVEYNLKYNGNKMILILSDNGIEKIQKEYELDYNEKVCYLPERMDFEEGKPFMITSTNSSLIAYALAKEKYEKMCSNIE